jgi:hypothetical protein
VGSLSPRDRLGDGADDNAPGKSNSFFEVLREHAGLAVSTVVISIGVLQILALAAYNSVSARAIVQYYGAVQLATLLVVQLAPMLALLAGTITAAWVIMQRIEGRRVPSWTAVLAAVAALIILSSIPILGLGIWLALTLVSAALGQLAWKRVQPSWIVFFFVTLVLSTFLALLQRQPVLPLEEVSVPKRPVLVGYVLQQADDSIVVLRERDRQVVRVPSTGASRQLCEAPPPQVRGPLQRLGRRAPHQAKGGGGIVPLLL